jgi:hypothetical protein
MAAERYRLVTRSDFDGLVCAVLLRQLELVEDIVFVHPKDVQDGLVEIGPGDITTNLPYSPGASWSSTTITARPSVPPPTPTTTSSTRTPPRRPGWSTTTTAGLTGIPPSRRN